MGFGQFEQREAQPMADINVVPLVDVMLVLVIILMVTTPLMTQALRVDLPQTQPQTANPTPPARIQLGADAAGQLYWDSQPIAFAELPPRLAQAARQIPQPEVHLSIDQATRYQVVAELLDAARVAGLSKIGFVTQPVANSLANKP